LDFGNPVAAGAMGGGNRRAGDAGKLTTKRRVCYSMRPIYQQQEESWRTKKRNNARTRYAPVHPRKVASIAAPHAKAQARPLSLIATVDIPIAPETSDLFSAIGAISLLMLRD